MSKKLTMFRVCSKNPSVFQNRNYLHKYLKSNAKYSSIKVTDSKVLGIRREDLNVWERRAPIAPQNVKELTDQGKLTILNSLYTMFRLLLTILFLLFIFMIHCCSKLSFKTENSIDTGASTFIIVRKFCAIKFFANILVLQSNTII